MSAKEPVKTDENDLVDRYRHKIYINYKRRYLWLTDW